MTDNENMAKLERKLETYRYLFAHGNESPTERQVNCWMEYDDGRLGEDQEKTELSVEEKVQQKITILQNAGLYSRAKVLQDNLTNFRTASETPLLTSIKKHIKQMEIRARDYLPHVLRSRDALLLDTVIKNYLATNSASKNEEAVEATKSLQRLLDIKHQHLARRSDHNQLQDFRGLLGEDISEVLFDIEQLAHLGINNHTYGIKFSKEGYKKAMGNIRQTRAEREKDGKTFDRVVFMINNPNNSCHDHSSHDWSDYLVAEMKAEVPYKCLFIYNYDPNDRWICDQRDDIAKVLGGGQIAIDEKDVLTRSYKIVTGYELNNYSAWRILQQYYGDTRKFECYN